MPKRLNTSIVAGYRATSSLTVETMSIWLVLCMLPPIPPGVSPATRSSRPGVPRDHARVPRGVPHELAVDAGDAAHTHHRIADSVADDPFHRTTGRRQRVRHARNVGADLHVVYETCLLYTSDAADDL